MSQEKNETRPDQGEPADQADNTPLHKAETKKIPPSGSDAEKKETAEGETQPMAAYDAPEAGGPLPEVDEGPSSQPVDEIQEAIFQAGREGVKGDVEFEALPTPTLDSVVSEPDEAGEAAEQEETGEVPFDDLPEPLPEIDEGPPPQPVDEIQEALFQAGRQGVSPEVDFEALPAPQLPEPRKKISRPVRRSKPEESNAPEEADTPPESSASQPTDVAPDTVPLPDFAETAATGVRSEFGLILSLFVSFRLLTLFLLRPGGFIRDWSDFDTYFGIAGLSDYGLFPFLDFWLEWPPLMPWLMVGIYRLSLLLPPWPDDPRLWFILMLGGFFLLFEIGNFLLIHRLSRRLFQADLYRNRVLWLYAGLFPPVYAMLGFFDGVALFFILLSVELLLLDQRFPSAIIVGLGFLVKIIPVLMLPVALRRLWGQYQEKPREAGIEMGLYGVVFGLTIVFLLSPLLVAGPEWVLASFRSILDRSSWETIWAVMEGYYGFGVVGGNRLNPAETNFAINSVPSPDWFIPMRIFFSLGLGALYLFLLLRPLDYRRPRILVGAMGLTVAFFMLYSKGYSPQFLVYLLPFIILLLPNARGVTYALMFTGLNVLEQPIYFVLIPEARWLLIFIVTIRFLLTIIIAAEFVLLLWPDGNWAERAALLRRRAPLALGGFSAVALIILMPLMIRAYAAEQLRGTPVGTLAGFVKALEQNPADLTNCAPPESQSLFLSDQTTYRQLYPHLSGAVELQLTVGAPEGSDVPSPGQWLPPEGRAWVLPTGSEAQRLQNAAERRGRLLGTFAFGELGTAALYDFTPNSNAPACLPLARLGNSVELLAHAIDANARRIDVTLYWRTITEPPQNLTVFTQLLNADGQQVAGHDSVPQNGTAPLTSWPLNDIQADAHRLTLPPNLPPGEYRLIAGLYRSDSGQRLRAIGPDGFNYGNQAVPLGNVQLR